jgi:UDP-N-acetyl-D-mannosaminuronic acid dehydrogenase
VCSSDLRQVNNGKPMQIVERVRARAARIQNPTIACFGLAYKADIDDLRESPAFEIARALAEARAGLILAVEPNIDCLPESLSELGVRLVGIEQALQEADIVVGLVAHRGFKKIAPKVLREKIVIDTCGIWFV